MGAPPRLEWSSAPTTRLRWPRRAAQDTLPLGLSWVRLLHRGRSALRATVPAPGLRELGAMWRFCHACVTPTERTWTTGMGVTPTSHLDLGCCHASVTPQLLESVVGENGFP